MSACLILEDSESHDWPECWGGMTKIPVERRPTMLQCDRAAAEQEVQRLAGLHPGKRFVVFEAVSAGMTINVPTHINYAGEVLIRGNTTAVVRIDDPDDGIPF